MSVSKAITARGGSRKVASETWLADGPSADGGPPSVTSEGCSYSGTWSWVKPVSIPESPPLGLYDTVPVQLCRQLHVKCCALLYFNCPEVVQLYGLRYSRGDGRARVICKVLYRCNSCTTYKLYRAYCYRLSTHTRYNASRAKVSVRA